MKLQENHAINHSRGVQSKNSYTVAQSAKVMDMFSNMLYSNKIRAVIRELSTNAWDAHIKAGNTDQAPEIHLPTSKNPEFYLRDFGTGLSKDHLEKMYSTYGHSDKTDSNDFNGCMGIGSKSPFAYCNMFTTTSFYNGMKYVYVNSKDRSGIPQIQLMHEEKTDEPNGLMIQFSTSKGDNANFAEEAASILTWFPVMFTMKGKFVDPVKSEYVLKEDFWALRKYDYWNSKSFAIMGNVAYPIEEEKFMLNEDEQKDKTAWYQHYKSKGYNSNKVSERFFSNILNMGFDIHFDTGEVDMDISREGLQYNDHTIKAIKKKLKLICESVGRIFADSVKDADCKWDAMILASNLSGGALRPLKTLVNDSTIQFQGRQVPSYLDNNCKLSRSMSFSYDPYRKKPKQENNIGKFYPIESCVFMIGDKKAGNFIAAERYINNSKDSDGKNPSTTLVYLVVPDDQLPQTIKDAKDELKKLVDCKDDCIVYASEVPVPKTVKKSADKTKVFKLNISKTSTWAKSGHWEAYDVDLKNPADNHYYVEINNWSTKNPNVGIGFQRSNMVYTRSLTDVLDFLKTNVKGFKYPTVVGVKTASIKKFNDSDKWTNLFDFLEKELDKYLKSAKLLNKVNAMESFSDDCDEAILQLCKFAMENVKEMSDPTVKEFYDESQRMKSMKDSLYSKYQELSRHYNVLKFNLPESTNSKLNYDWATKSKIIRDRFPFVNFLSSWQIRNGAGHKYSLIQSIKAFDLLNRTVNN